MRRLFVVIIFLQVLVQPVLAQVSQGGTPMKVMHTKSKGIPVVVMPPVDHHALQKENEKLQPEERSLRAFRFAVGFGVDISPEDQGIWTSGMNGFDIWQVKIRSEGAYSLGLTFDDFHLPPGSRLFLYNEQEGHFLGAFTSLNNKLSGKFAVSPVAGEEITVQYETPSSNAGEVPFVVAEVSHDYMGILKNERRPMQIQAGDCNIDINCPPGEAWKDVKDAVCRIIISKPDLPLRPKEICTGTLMNNTAEDQRPYILTAAHCFDKEAYAETAIYTFNYESPYCAPLDGDPVRSISGSSLLASSDSLDFALLELSVIPPPDYQPYYAGWDNRIFLPDSSVSIHHPQGDIKKIAVDHDAPRRSDFDDGYTPGGFLRILEWDEGVTEAGSSGGALFNPGKFLIGTLTGGLATCIDPTDDFYSRFDLAWEFRADSSKQLKHWLDPLQNDVQTLTGKRFYTGEDLCMGWTHLEDFDAHDLVVLNDNNGFAGYWGGTNRLGISGFTERFIMGSGVILRGLSMGIGKIRLSSGSNAEVNVKVYNGRNQPENQIYSTTVKAGTLVADAVNYIGFDYPVEPTDTFFVGFELNNFQSADTFAVYQSLRESGKENFFWFSRDGAWYNFQTSNDEGLSMVNVFELVACNVSGVVTDTPLVRETMAALIYPNPASSLFTIEAGHQFMPEDVRVYNLIGQVTAARLVHHQGRKIQIDLTGNLPGVYFVQIRTGKGTITKKVSWAPR